MRGTRASLVPENFLAPDLEPAAVVSIACLRVNRLVRQTLRSFKSLGKNFKQGTNRSFFEMERTKVRTITQSNGREPGVNPGRLRHCNGYEFPKTTGRKAGKEGIRYEAGVRIPV
jgi:hypothetical protein